ncbi:MAG: patatin family protein, partial [Proteobacteria bacterium]|nr:patatin family protein [Pseudomonadota bacterium]
LWVGVTDCMSGTPLYFSQAEQGDATMALFRATCALPVLSRPVHLGELVLMDGGVSDPIPVQRSVADGNRRHVIVLTQPKGYIKEPTRGAWLAQVRHRGLPGLHRALAFRHEVYNLSMAMVEHLERYGHAFVIRPEVTLGVGRICRDRAKLESLYDQGMATAEALVPSLEAFLGTP